jgi:hypothetical protein
MGPLGEGGGTGEGGDPEQKRVHIIQIGCLKHFFREMF